MLTPGEILKNKRNSLGKTIFEVSQETRILEKYLKQIESNQFDQFDSPVFARGFIKIYAQYLNLDEEKVLALFRRENKELNTKNEVKQKNNLKDLKSLSNSKNILIGLTAIVILAVISVLYYQLYLFQLTPKLEVFSPINGLTTEANSIEVKGLSDKHSKITLNNVEIENKNGSFQTNTPLLSGENIITIKATNIKNPSKSKESVIKVTYNEKKIEEKPAKPVTLSIEILDDPTWLKLNIDGLQKLAQVLSPSFIKKYTVTKEFEIVTGRPDQTIILINKVERKLKINDKTGVATLKCTLKDIELNCSE